MNALHIIIANDFAHVNGGTAKIAVGSALALARMGHRVTMFTAVGPVAPELRGVPGIEVICLDQDEILADPNRLRAASRGVWNGQAASVMRQLLKRCDRTRTVVHVHGWTKALTASVIQTAADLQYPVVVTLHDYFAACPAGTFYQFPQNRICHLRPMSTGCVGCNCDARSYPHKLWRVGRQWVQEHMGGLPRQVQHFISISDLSESVLRPYLPARAQVHRVRNFVEVPKTEPIAVRDNRLFAYSGRFSREKGPALFAEAAVLAGVPPLFIGDGPLRAELEQQAPDSTITGWLSGEQALHALRQARALVFPSLWYETQGLVVAEAAAMGLPAVVPDTCAAREWVADGATGLWFRGGDAADLAAKLSRLHQDAEYAAELGYNAYLHYWAKPTTLEHHGRQLEEVYGRMLAAVWRPSPALQPRELLPHG